MTVPDWALVDLPRICAGLGLRVEPRPDHDACILFGSMYSAATGAPSSLRLSSLRTSPAGCMSAAGWLRAAQT
jgi:hypothetical protein